MQDGAAPLTVADLNALRLDAKLAYLAACDSTFTHQLLADEAVHITAAFHLAGFRQVIGTLWPVSDLFAAGISAAVYGRMTGAGSRAPDVSLAPQALHDAVRALRDRRPHVPSAWAGFIHVGGAQLG